MGLNRLFPDDDRSSSVRPGQAGIGTFVLVFLFTLSQIPIVSAHGGTATSALTRWHVIFTVLGGIAVLAGATYLKRSERISPTLALYGVFFGIALASFGAILFEGLSPDPTYAASSMPFPRSWYTPLALAAGLLIVILSFAIGWVRWPSRPRFTFLGMLLGVWILYPYLLPGVTGYSHPLGYMIVVGTPVLVGYILWRDAGGALRTVLRDPVARRFGVGVGILAAGFFVSITGYLSFFPDESVPDQANVVVLPVIYQLVSWPTLEVSLPHVPLFFAVSPGLVIVVGMVSVLVGLNAALIARRWRVEDRAGLAEGTAGSAAIVGSCTCGCCGPLVAKIAMLAVGPSIAAPLYWVFVDSASPLSLLFVMGSIVLFTGSLVYSVEAARQPQNGVAVVPAD